MEDTSIYYRTDERFVVCGGTGTGKTVFVKEGLADAIPPGWTVVVVDPKRDQHWKHIPSIKYDLFRRPQIERGQWQAFRWPQTDGDEDEDLAHDPAFIRLLREIWELRNVLIIVDETAAIFPDPHSMIRIMGRIIREGRQRGIGIIWLIQRPSSAPTIIFTEAESWAAFTLRRLEDRKTAAGYMGDEVEQKPPHPEEDGQRSHVFWYVRPGMSTPVLKRLRLAA